MWAILQTEAKKLGIIASDLGGHPGFGVSDWEEWKKKFLVLYIFMHTAS